MKSFEDFLASQKDATVDHVVVGNAAGDADSIISALTYGYIESELGGGGTTKTPFVSISKNDLETQRPEVAFLFRALGLGTIVDSLRFIDDPILRDNQNKRKLTLVDHNRAEEIFQSNLSHWDVVEILDHHFDEQQHVDTCPSGESRHVAFDGDNGLLQDAWGITLRVDREINDALDLTYVFGRESAEVDSRGDIDGGFGAAFLAAAFFFGAAAFFTASRAGVVILPSPTPAITIPFAPFLMAASIRSALILAWA